MLVLQGNSFAAVYEELLHELMTEPEYVTQPRDMKINEMCDVMLIIEDPLLCLYQNEFRSSQSKYIAAEFLWYFMGRNDVAYISKYAKFWESIQNEDGTVNSAYGNLIFTQRNEHGFTQYEWALTSLLKDRDSRQAILHFNLPSHQWNGNKDFVCTMYAIFQIRNNRLNFTVSMRSNDVILGLPTDIAFFTILQSQMLNHLRYHAGYQDLEMGTYTHISNSSHIYERHFEMAKKMITRKFEPIRIPEVNLPLILENGKPSSDLTGLFNGPSAEFNDPLYNWIQNNLLS